jgi:hypothetical protein
LPSVIAIVRIQIVASWEALAGLAADRDRLGIERSSIQDRGPDEAVGSRRLSVEAALA